MYYVYCTTPICFYLDLRTYKTLQKINFFCLHYRSRINSYRALASPSLIALSSKDPILTAFELSWELRRLSFAEHEFKSEYMVRSEEIITFSLQKLSTVVCYSVTNGFLASEAKGIFHQLVLIGLCYMEHKSSGSTRTTKY